MIIFHVDGMVKGAAKMSSEKEYAILIRSDRDTIASLQDKIMSGIIKAFEYKVLEKNEKGELVESADF